MVCFPIFNYSKLVIGNPDLYFHLALTTCVFSVCVWHLSPIFLHDESDTDSWISIAEALRLILLFSYGEKRKNKWKNLYASCEYFVIFFINMKFLMINWNRLQNIRRKFHAHVKLIREKSLLNFSCDICILTNSQITGRMAYFKTHILKYLVKSNTRISCDATGNSICFFSHC